MNKVRKGRFARIFRIAREDILFGYRKQLIGRTIWVGGLFSRDGPWCGATGMVVGKDISLNGTKLKKGDHICLRRVILQPVSFSS